MNKLKVFKQFVIVAKSENTNSFGLHQYIVIAKDGEAWKVHRTLSFPWQRSEVISVEIEEDGNRCWAGLSCEMPQRLKPDAPPKVIRDAWAVTGGVGVN